ncbi:MAG TPA: GDSL-type esterase/lipase family protein [Chloroflexota bacterium]|nr:GDSL-type esterase/lipase family protein [Chloroflexota bacterium]
MRGSRAASLTGTSVRIGLLVAVIFLGAGASVLAGATVHPAARDGPARLATVAHRSARSYRFVYVAIGASDSYGVGTDDPAMESWPAVLARYLPPGTHFVNLGVPGILLHRAVEVELPVALDAHPTLVTVWLAVNDLAAGVPLPQYRHDLGVLLRTLRHATHARVLIANVPNLALLPAFGAYRGLGPMVAAWNAVIAAAARAHGAILVDVYARWRDLALHPEYVAPDGLHPTAEGYRRLAELFWRVYRTSRSPRA